MRIEARHHRESERLVRNISDYDLERQEEMMLEFDQSAFTQDLVGGYNTIHIAKDQNTSDTYSNEDFFDTNPTPNNLSANQTLTPKLRSLSDRVHTPARIYNLLARNGNDILFSQDV